MIPALIDLHVRPLLNDQGQHDIDLIAVQARDRGLDGVVVLPRDEAVALGDVAPASAATGVQFFVGVELPTERGPLLCYPRTVDAWFLEAGWRSLAQASGTYVAADVIRTFGERGGAVIAQPAAAIDDALPTGLAGLVVASSTLDESAAALAQAARVTSVGGSGAAPGEAAFGRVATTFASPPSTQEALVEGLRSGRAWPAEIGTPELAALASKPTPSAARQSAPSQPQRSYGGDTIDMRSPTPSRQQSQTGAQRQRPKPDAFERPGDNRGNRLNRDEVRKVTTEGMDDTQPTFDPVAAMYGLDARKVHRFAHKTDAELDRINGNRAKGPDTNIMLMPSFDELRQERQRVNLLFARTEEESALEDSISLRFALAHFEDDEDALADLPSAPMARRRGRRRR